MNRWHTNSDEGEAPMPDEGHEPDSEDEEPDADSIVEPPAAAQFDRADEAESKRGGAERYRKFLSSAAWGQMRLEALHRDHGRCRRCGGVATEVHHERYVEPLELQDIDDLISLCGSCPDARHKEMYDDGRSESELRLSEISSRYQRSRR